MSFGSTLAGTSSNDPTRVHSNSTTAFSDAAPLPPRSGGFVVGCGVTCEASSAAVSPCALSLARSPEQVGPENATLPISGNDSSPATPSLTAPGHSGSTQSDVKSVVPYDDVRYPETAGLDSTVRPYSTIGPSASVELAADVVASERSPKTLRFGSVARGKSLTLPIHILNNGPGPIDLYVGLRSSTDDFTLSSDGTCRATLAAHSSCVMPVRFFESSRGGGRHFGCVSGWVPPGRRVAKRQRYSWLRVSSVTQSHRDPRETRCKE